MLPCSWSLSASRPFQIERFSLCCNSCSVYFANMTLETLSFLNIILPMFSSTETPLTGTATVQPRIFPNFYSFKNLISKMILWKNYFQFWSFFITPNVLARYWTGLRQVQFRYAFPGVKTVDNLKAKSCLSYTRGIYGVLVDRGAKVYKHLHWSWRTSWGVT
jgi:hypothetical protein